MLRTLTVRVDALEEGPSAQLRKRDDEGSERGDRPERGERRGPRGDRGERGDRGDRGERRPRRDEAAKTEPEANQ